MFAIIKGFSRGVKRENSPDFPKIIIIDQYKENIADTRWCSAK